MDNSNEQLEQLFKSCMKLRLEGLENALAENIRYRAMKLKLEALANEIKEELPEELKKKIEKYSRYQNKLSKIERPFVYRIAFSDVLGVVRFVFGEDKVPPFPTVK